MKSRRKSSKPEVRHNMNVLLITVPNKKKPKQYFTPKKNLAYLIEFARTFKASIQEVKVKTAVVLPLRHLINAFCDTNYTETAEYDIIKDLTPNAIAKNEKTQPRNTLQSQIRQLILKGQPLSTRKLCKKLNSKLSESTIRRHYKQVRLDLIEDGYTVNKISRGEYQLL